MIPLTWLPETVAIAILLGLGVGGSAWAIRRLGLPLWWLAFPPLVDGLWNANPHVLILPLLVAGLAPLAVIIKVYAGVVPLIRMEMKAIALSAAALIVTAPFLPYATFIDELPWIAGQLQLQSDGGISVWALPWPWLPVLLVGSIVALVLVGRERSAWWAVPVLWPSTQWYYSSLAIPGASMLSAAILAVPFVGGPVVAVVVLAVEQVLARRLQKGEPTPA
jgi:hypothetical protein